MAKRKKRAKAQPRRRAKLRRRTSAARARARKASKSGRRGGTKRSGSRARPKRAVKGTSRKKQQRAKSPSREVETVVVDVIEEPVPGVVTVTEFEETQIRGRGWVKTKGDHKS
jgi:hypothetical protein